MINKLILVGLVVMSANSFAYGYDDYNQNMYQRKMLEQQQEQNRIMQTQSSNQFNAAQDQKMHNDFLERQWFNGNNK